MELAFIKDGIISKVLIYDKDPEIIGSVDITNLSPKPGPGWSYDGQKFTPPIKETPHIDPDISKAKQILATINKANLLSTDEGKMLAVIALMLRAISTDDV